MMIEPLEIGTRKQLFIDDHVVDRIDGVERTLNQPAKYMGNPIMIPLYPWEGRLELYGTVLREPSGEFRMWYTGMGGMGVPPLSWSGPSVPAWKAMSTGSKARAKSADPSNMLYSICYATSNDGVFWDRPPLGLVDYKGSKDNNMVIPDACPANVIIDPRESNPDRLYKSLFFEARDPSGTPNMGDGVSVAFSPDGLHWTKYEGNPVITRASDAHTLLGWDDLHGLYVSYCRPSVHEGNMLRRIGRSVSRDFMDWTEPEDVLVPDDQDPEGMQFYSMPAFKYEEYYLGQIHAYRTDPEAPHVRFAGFVDVQLAASRDGIAWQRLGDRKPFIPNGPPGSIDAAEIYVAMAPVVMGDELWFYYSPGYMEHGVTGRSGPICLAKLRLDGFVSVDAGDEIGTLVTKPFLCGGGRLSINAAAGGGMVGLAVLDESGIQYPGFSRQECALFDGDSIGHNMTWREHLSLDELEGRSVRLKFYLKNAKLYAFSVGDRSGTSLNS
jgi:hypothetical protein